MTSASASSSALQVAQASPYPISSGGDGMMYAASLFAVVSITLLLTMRAIATGRQIVVDWNRQDRREVFWFRATILLICIAGIISRAPDAVYKIAWGEVSPETLRNILWVREWANPIAFVVVIGWIGLYSYFELAWTLRLSNPINRVWGGNVNQVKKFGLVVVLSALLACAVAVSKAFS